MNISEKPAAEGAKADELAGHLRQLIVFEHMPGGSKIREAELAEQFSTSRTPVREALKVIESEGLIIYERNKGYTVRTFSQQDIVEAYEMRALFEGYLSGQLASQGLPAATLLSLHECLVQAEALVRDRREPAVADIDAWGEINIRFHTLFTSTCTNSMMSRTMVNATRLPRLSAWLEMEKQNMAYAIRRYNTDHAEIVDAIERRNSLLAETLMREHIMRACRGLQDSRERKALIR